MAPKHHSTPHWPARRIAIWSAVMVLCIACFLLCRSHCSIFFAQQDAGSNGISRAASAFLRTLGQAAWPVVITLYLAHFLVLRLKQRLTTHSARLIGCVFALIICLSICSTVFLTYWMDNPDGFRFLGALVKTGLFLPVLLCVSNIIIFSLPSTFVSSIPLLLSYLAIALVLQGEDLFYRVMLGIFITLLPGIFFPRHRRLGEYWRPSRLPRLGTPKTTALATTNMSPGSQ